MSKTLTISKRNGEIYDRPTLIKQLECLLNTIANGEYIVSIQKKRQKRSLDQNALMWLWFACIERETGTSSQDIHDYYCKRFLERVVVVCGKQELVVGGTRNLSTDGMTDFLNKVQADAASELGIILPLPEDQYYEEFIKEYNK
jgi:hypothetical protein